MQPTIISCAVTGSAPTPEKNPAVPVTPTEIAESAIALAIIVSNAKPSKMIRLIFELALFVTSVKENKINC